MLNKLENSRFKTPTVRTSRVIAAGLLSAGILATSAMGASSAPQTSGLKDLTSQMSADAATTVLPGLIKAGWRPGGPGGHGGPGAPGAPGGPGGHAGPGGPRDPGMLFMLSDADLAAELSRMVRHAAIEIDATPEQVKQILAIVTPLALELKDTRGQFDTVGKDLKALLLADEVDGFAIEALRAEKLALADDISKKVTKALVAVAKILTPEQRKQLDARLMAFHAKGPGMMPRR